MSSAASLNLGRPQNEVLGNGFSHKLWSATALNLDGTELLSFRLKKERNKRIIKKNRFQHANDLPISFGDILLKG